MSSVFSYIKEEAGNKTKHRQIADGIIQAISEKELKQGDMLPSVNVFTKKLSVARMTIVKALEDLKAQGIIESKYRVGYFVKNNQVKRKLRVMLFLTEFNVYHEVAYKEILAGLKEEDVIVDLYFHHCNPQVFKTILKENLGLYDLYIITPFNHPQVKKSLAEIPARKLLQVMRPPELEGTSYIEQEFHDEVLEAFNSIKNELSKYHILTIVFPERGTHPKEIGRAFHIFCSNSDMAHTQISHITKEAVKKGSAFFVIADNDLIDLVKYGEEKGLVIGKNLGILSYNDTPMKAIIRNGITVISADFIEFGRSISEFIRTRRPIQKRISTRIILRQSL